MVDFTGDANPNNLVGDATDDLLQGLGGNDTLNGGAGKDTLEGGAGDDRLVVAHAPGGGESYDGGADTDTLFVQTSSATLFSAQINLHLVNFLANPAITLTSIETLGFGSASGEILLVNIGSSQIGSGLATNATLVGGAGTDLFNVNVFNGGEFTAPSTLVLDASWNSATDVLAPHDQVTLVGNGNFNYTLTAAEGHAGVQGLTGGSGNDTLIGTDGVEALNGNAGIDVIDAKGGNDLVIIGQAGGTPSPVVAGESYDGGAGVDTLQIGVAALFAPNPDDDAQVELFNASLNSFEKLQFLSNAGQELSVAIDRDQLGTGIASNATLIGGAGNDRLLIGVDVAGTYTLNDYSFTKQNWTDFDSDGDPGDVVALVATGAGDYVLSASTSHGGIEALVGGEGDDSLTGSDGVEVLISGGGKDTIHGAGGNDFIEVENPFEAGAIFDGGAGTDTLELDTGAATADGADYTVDLRQVTLTSIERLVSDGEDDSRFTVMVDASQVGGGLSGTAELVGGDGDHTLTVVAGAAGSYTLASFVRGDGWTNSTDASTPGDTVVLTADNQSGDYTLNASANHLGVEVLLGGNGNDTLNGGTGIEILNGGSGDDQLFGGGNDLIEGGDGNDVAVFSGASTSYAVSAGASDSVLVGGSRVSEVEVFRFTDGDFTFNGTQLMSIDTNGSLTGDTGNQVINGTAQADEIRPGGGTDTVNANGGDDRIILDAAIVGGVYNGNAGTDTLELREIAGSPSGAAGPQTRYAGLGVNGIEQVDYQSTSGNAVLLALGYHVVNANGTFTLATPSVLFGGDGTDSYVLAAIGGMGTDSNIVLPTLTANDWTNPTRAYQAGDIIALTAADGANYRLSASEANGTNGLRQLLIGNSGNDTLNGSAGKDVLNGAGGVNQLNGNGGDDALVIANAAGSGFTGAGSSFNGGDGTDFLSVGGVVDFQGTVSSIEGIYLQPAFTSNVPNVPGQEAAELTIGSATIGAMASNLILDGIGEITVNIASGGSFNGAAYSFEVGSDIEFSLIGTSGNQSIAGTSGDDYIAGRGGTDSVNAGGGDDVIVLDALSAGGSYNGGDGTDTLVLATIPGSPKGANGPVTLYAGSGISNIEQIAFQTTAGTATIFAVGYHVVNGNGTFTIAAPSQLSGSAGLDTFLLAATGGMGTDANIIMPTFTTTNWTTSARGYQPSDIVVLQATDNNAYQLTASDSNSGIRQALLGNAGDDTLNGSSGSDLLNGNGGVNELHGNDGDDVLGVTGGNTGAGSLYDGGNGTDFLSVGGAIAFQGSVQSIEGIFLQSAYTSTAQGQPSQGVAALTISGQTIGAMASNLILGGSGSITVNVGAGLGFDGSAYTFEANSTVRFTLNGADGAESISGTSQSDLIGGGLGADTLSGGGGADTIVGGDGDDVIDGGADTDIARFDGTRASFVISAGPNGSVMVGGDQVSNVEIFSFTDGDFSLDGLDLLGVNQGTVADGYISGATVFIDVNGNGQLDGGEDSTTTDANGNYTLTSDQSGSLVATGGTNTDTGLANNLVFSAPAGSTVINPLTTLIEALVSDSVTAEQAQAQVKAAFGLDADIDLLSLDLVGAAAVDADGLAAQKAAVAVAELLNSVADNDGDTKAALATLGDLVGGGQSVDLTSQQVLTDVITAGLADASPQAIAMVVQETQALTQAIADAESINDVTGVQANAAPDAVADNISVDEDATISGNVRSNDTDGDSDVLTVVSVDGQAISGATAIQGAFGVLTMNADGSYSYVANGDQIDALATGQQRTDTFSYMINDGKGGVDSANLAILITAINDSVAVTLDSGQASFEGNGADENITGTSTSNTIRGMGGADVITGGGGNDSMSGGAGDDSVTAGSGHDYLYGGLMTSGDGEGGNDTLIGGAGNDHIYGNSLAGAGNATDGADMIDAGDGVDYVNGNAGNDTIDGGAGRDRIQGGRDDDSVSGGDGHDVINGNAGNDTISGDSGNDLLRGGQGNDVLRGGAGDDQMFGDLGNDTLFAGAGVDLMTGGGGADRFDFSENGAGNFDTVGHYAAILDFDGTDRIRLAFAVNSGEVLQGGSFGSEASARAAATTQLAGHAGTQDVVAAQVGSNTFLFYNAAGNADPVTGIIALVGVTATTIDHTDFTF